MLRLDSTCELLRVPFKASWSLPVNNSVTDVEKKKTVRPQPVPRRQSCSAVRQE